MTAGRSAGTEQGQGREVVCHCPLNVTEGATLDHFELDGDAEFRGSFTGPSTGRDEAREAVARWLATAPDYVLSAHHAPQAADELLSLPAVAALLRDGTTT